MSRLFIHSFLWDPLNLINCQVIQIYFWYKIIIYVSYSESIQKSLAYHKSFVVNKNLNEKVHCAFLFIITTFLGKQTINVPTYDSQPPWHAVKINIVKKDYYLPSALKSLLYFHVFSTFYSFFCLPLCRNNYNEI